MGIGQHDPLVVGRLHTQRDGQLLAAHVARGVGDVGGVETRVRGIGIQHILGVAVALFGHYHDLEVGIVAPVEEQRQVASQHRSLLLLNRDENGHGGKRPGACCRFVGLDGCRGFFLDVLRGFFRYFFRAFGVFQRFFWFSRVLRFIRCGERGFPEWAQKGCCYSQQNDGCHEDECYRVEYHFLISTFWAFALQFLCDVALGQSAAVVLAGHDLSIGTG